MTLQATVFATPLGWFGLVGQDRCVCRLIIGHRRADDVWTALHRGFASETLVSGNWHPTLKNQLREFAAGRPVLFDEIAVSTGHRTEFQQKVLIATRAIEFGETISYGDLAARVGSPRAARAVGAVMASNSVPIIIPCHRVVGSGGTLGGFSAPNGLKLKEQMLELESRAMRRLSAKN